MTLIFYGFYNGCTTVQLNDENEDKLIIWLQVVSSYKQQDQNVWLNNNKTIRVYHLIILPARFKNENPKIIPFIFQPTGEYFVIKVLIRL